MAIDITERLHAEEALRQSEERLRLLWESAAVLLTTEEPDAMLRGLFTQLAPHLGLDAYFNYMVNDAGDALRLESCVGIPEDTARSVTRLEFGQAICGTDEGCGTDPSQDRTPRVRGGRGSVPHPAGPPTQEGFDGDPKTVPAD